MNITAKQLRTHVRQALAAVDRGETVNISYRGQPKAQLTAVDKGPSDESDSIYGMWSDNKDMDDIDAYVRNLRKSRQG